MSRMRSRSNSGSRSVADNTDEDKSERSKNLDHDFHGTLSDHPEILKYIEKLRKIIRKQQKKIDKLNTKLKDHKRSKNDRVNVGTQTEASSKTNDGGDKAKGSFKVDNIAEEVKEAAELALKQTSFVYEPTSGMYYDYNTGYYYNAELRLYYDGNSGKYLVYDEEAKEYKYQDGTPATNQPATTTNKEKKRKKPVKNSKSKKKKRSRNGRGTDTEDGEVSSSDCNLGSDAEEVVDGYSRDMAEAAAACEPCIRVMVEDTNVDKLKVGTLFVVTCKGGTLGREGDHAVLLPDIGVSKHHARFIYDETEKEYTLTDLGSRNGTWLNGKRMSVALQESDAQVVSHGAVVQVGGSKLLCHVHVGRDTCAQCEPGLVMVHAERSGPALPTVQYKEQLHNLKKKFGVGAPVPVATGYEDRAELRRTTVGSSHHSEKTQVAAVTEPINKTNKGFSMLAKMGWTEGQKLGKNEKGLAEPVPIVSNEGKTGLGASSMNLPTITHAMKKKQHIIQKTQDRYRNIPDVPKQVDNEADEDDEYD